MVFSLPSYRRLSEADLHRLRNDSAQRTSARIARILFNILLLVGLWGLPLYLRSFVSSKPSGTIDPHEAIDPEAIIGRWRSADGSGAVLEFTRDGALRLSREGIVKLTAHYRFNERGDIVFYDINPPLVIDHQEEPGAQCRYTLRFTGDGFSVTDRGWEFDAMWRGSDRITVGPVLFSSNHFKRVQ